MERKVSVTIRNMNRELWKVVACLAKMEDKTIAEFISSLVNKYRGEKNEGTSNKQ